MAHITLDLGFNDDEDAVEAIKRMRKAVPGNVSMRWTIREWTTNDGEHVKGLDEKGNPILDLAERDKNYVEHQIRRIDVSQWWESKTELGEPLLMALGLDGIVYRLTQRKRDSI